MRRFIFFFCFLLCYVSFLHAQKASGTVKGVLQDSVTGSPLSEATISLLRVPDSSLISFTISSRNGQFEIKNIALGSYHLITSFEGLQTKRTAFQVSDSSLVIDLGVISLDRAYKTLDEVVVKDIAPIKFKGDTLSFNADAFKTKPNATAEDLLKKLPGVQVDRDGTVKAQGEEVQKVYVDGKEFFGNDPKMATKNITADMIDEVEVFDDASQASKFNKIDDGSRTKAINLKLKKEKKRGVFGKAYAGYGTNDHYDAGVTTNFFKSAMQTTVIAKTNNVNNLGFTSNDMIGMSGGASSGRGVGGRSASGGRTGGNFGGLNTGVTGNGVTASSQLGANYHDSWGKNVDITGSYFYTNAQTTNTESLFRQTFGSNAITYFDQKRNALNSNNNHQLNLNLAWIIDSLNSILYYPTLTFQKSNYHSNDTTAIYATANNGLQQDINRSRQNATGSGEGLSWINNLIWRKRFALNGRTLSVSITNTINDTKRESYNIFKAAVNPRNIYSPFTSNNLSYSGGFSYTEPLSRTRLMEINYGYSNNENESDKGVLSYNHTTGKYDVPDLRQSNHFTNTNEVHRGGLNFRTAEKKYNYQLGIAVQYAHLTSNNITKQSRLDQYFLNIFPTAIFNYQFSRNQSVRFFYRGTPRQPNATQLQDVIDESNAPYFYRGNPALKQEFYNNVNLRYNFFNIRKFQNVFASVNFSNGYNRIANSIKDTTGGQLTIPVNLDGYYTVNGNFNIGFPVERIAEGNFNATTRFSYTKDPSLYNGEQNFTNSLNIAEDIRFDFNLKKKLFVGLTASLNYNAVSYRLKVNEDQSQSYFTHSYLADISYTFLKNFIFTTQFDYTFNTGRTSEYNTNFALFNASLARQVFKNKKGEIKLSAFDILNQNTNITRNIGAGYIEDIKGLTLERYFMLTLTYNIAKMGGKKPASK